MKRILLTVIFMVALAMPATLIAGVPQLINYQGRLTNSAGNPLDTTVSITFSIYVDSAGGTPIWTETHPSVSVVNGLFSVILGSLTKSAWILCWDPDLGWVECNYIGITVGASPEITPRTRLTSSMYSFHSATVDNFNPGPMNVDSGAYSLIGGDSNKVLSGYSSIAGGFKNVIDITNVGDTLVDTSFTPDFTGGTHFGIGGRTAGYGSFIGGGYGNHSHGNYSVIGGGWVNTAWCPYSGILAGVWNQAGGLAAFVGAGVYNIIGTGISCNCGYASAIVAGGYNNIQGNYAFIGGGLSNKIQGCFAYNTIGGGRGNIVSNDYAVIGGGGFNTANGQYSTIGGGLSNQAAGIQSTIGGGDSNYVSTNALKATIGGGFNNQATGIRSTIGGGSYNKATGIKSTVGGGDSNYVSLETGTIGGGHGNSVTNHAGTVAGGEHDTVQAQYGTVGGGNLHFIYAQADWGTIAGGSSNMVNDSGGAILGGTSNSAVGSYASIGGGKNNSTGGHCATIPGGSDNRANGRFSLAAGQQARALHAGSYVWNDNSAGVFASTNENQFLIHAAGNTGIMTNAPHSTLHDNGSFAVGYKYTAVDYTATSSDFVIEAQPPLAAPPNLVINLPQVTGGLLIGRIYTIKNTGGAGRIVEVNAYGLELIDGSMAYYIASSQWVTIVSNGTKWLIIGN